MADISILARFIDGRTRNVNLSTDALVVGSLKIGAQELTETILGNLISLQDGSDFADGASAHTHDGRYFTEAEIGSTANGEGASLMGVEDVAGNFTGANVEAVLAELFGLIDGSNDASEITYTPGQLSDWTGSLDPGNVDGALDQLAARLTTAEGQVSTNTADIALRALDADVLKKDGSVALEGNQDMGGNRLTGLPATFSLANEAVSKAYVDAVRTSGRTIGDIRVASSVDIDLSSLPATIDGITMAANERFLARGQSDLTENGVYTYPGSGLAAVRVAELDNSPEGEIYNGILTSRIKEGSDSDKNFTIISSGTGTDGLHTVGVDNIVWDDFSAPATLSNTDELPEGSTNFYYTEGRFDTSFSGKSTADLSEDPSALYFTDARARTAAVADAIADGVLDIAPSQNAVFDALALKQDADPALDEAVTFFSNTDLSAAEAEQLSDGSNADSLHEHAQLKDSKDAGEAFGANVTKAVRFALSGETAGRLYSADNDVSSTDQDQVMGFVSPTASISAGNPIKVQTQGTLTLGSGDTNFNATDIGKRVYLTTSGDFSVTAPSGADVSVKPIGIVEDVDKLFIKILDGYIDAA